MPVPGGHVALGQTPNASLGTGLVLAMDGIAGDTNRYNATPSNPTGPASTTATMMGLAGSITIKNGNGMLLLMSGDVLNATIADGVNLQLSYGTGAAPANAATLTGTQVGPKIAYVAATAAEKAPFCLHAYVTGLVAGTTYWLDLAANQITGGAVTLENIGITAIEI